MDPSPAPVPNAPITTDPEATARWRALDAAHYLHPFTDTKALAAEGGSRIIVAAEGVRLWDSEGHALLDGMAGLWNVALGYGRAELAEAAAAQMRRLSYYNSFFKTATPPSVELAARLAELAPAGLEHVFFTNSGSEANDTIIRMARHYWTLKGQPQRQTIISREYAYHGSTLAAASACGPGQMPGGQGGLPLPGFSHILPPYHFDFGGDLAPETFGRQAAQALEARIQELGPETVAAFIAEPIQGAGGVIIPPPGYWAEVQRICRAYDVLLIADEVICGFGRTGAWFASERFDIAPDFMTVAKGITSGYLPLGAALVGERVARTLIDAGGEFFHGFTYSGHPVPCAVALETLRLMAAERVVETVAEDTGPYLAERLATLRDHPLVGEVRSFGLLGAVELCADKQARTRVQPPGRAGQICRDHCLARGAVLRAVRDAIVMAPPLVITRADIDALLEVLRAALDATARDLGVA